MEITQVKTQPTIFGNMYKIQLKDTSLQLYPFIKIDQLAIDSSLDNTKICVIGFDVGNKNPFVKILNLVNCSIDEIVDFLFQLIYYSRPKKLITDREGVSHIIYQKLKEKIAKQTTVKYKNNGKLTYK